MAKKILVLSMALVMCLGLFAGCNNEDDMVDDILKQGVYATDDGLAGVVLNENNEFAFNRGVIYSHIPTGNYYIEGVKLILRCNDNYEFVFDIVEDQIVFAGTNVNGIFTEEGPVSIRTIFIRTSAD